MPGGFDVARINVETYLWHGDNDHTVTLAMSMGQRHAAMISHAQMKIYPCEGHFSVPIRHMREILQTLCVDHA
jgi:pimeloyl-ACP methyl ester carboxylesterase